MTVSICLQRYRTVDHRRDLQLKGECDLQGVNNARNVSQYCQDDVDEEVGIATAFEEDTERREEDGEDDFADVATMHKGQLCFE